MVVVVAGFGSLLGCRGPSPARPLPPLSRARAEGIVNANASRIDGTLRAIGSVDATVVDAKGARRSFSLDGVLFYLRPSFLRFDLKKFGDRQILLGSNDQQCWVFTKQDGAYRCGGRNGGALPPQDFPVQPQQLLDALGLAPITDSLRGDSIGRTQRIQEESQQILFLVRDESGDVVIEKEYWLDRFAPRLIRNVVFRDENGELEMASHLGDYRELGEGGPVLPYLMRARWPRAGVKLTFTISKWSLHPTVGPTGPQFSTPQECSVNGT